MTLPTELWLWTVGYYLNKEDYDNNKNAKQACFITDLEAKMCLASLKNGESPAPDPTLYRCGKVKVKRTDPEARAAWKWFKEHTITPCKNRCCCECPFCDD